jgi:hypothetical protein
MNAEVKTTMRVTIIMKGVGMPFSIDPVKTASQRYAHLIGKSRNNVQATAARKT